MSRSSPGIQLSLIICGLLTAARKAGAYGNLKVQKPAILGRNVTIWFTPDQERDVMSADSVLWYRSSFGAGTWIPTTRDSVFLPGYDRERRLYFLKIVNASKSAEMDYYVVFNTNSSPIVRVKLQNLTGCGMLVGPTEPVFEGKNLVIRLVPTPHPDTAAPLHHQWLFNGNPLQNGATVHKSYNPKTDEYHLRVTGITRDRSGRYELRCGQGFATNAMEPIDIVIFFPPAVVSISNPEIPDYVAETYEIKLTCYINESNPACIPDWTSLGRSTATAHQTSKETTAYGYNVSQAVLYSVPKEYNFRPITCQAICDRYPQLQMNASYEILLPYKPTISLTPSILPAQPVKSSVTIRCAVKSAPEADVVWVRAKDGRGPEIDLSSYTERCGEDFCLMLRNLKEKDGGNYTCKADNRVFPASISTIEISVNASLPLPPSADSAQAEGPSLVAVVAGLACVAVVVAIVIVAVVIYKKHSQRRGRGEGFISPKIEMQDNRRKSSTQHGPDPPYGNVTVSGPSAADPETTPLYAAVAPRSQRASQQAAPSEEEAGLIYIQLDHDDKAVSRKLSKVNPSKAPEEATEYTSIDFARTGQKTENAVCSNSDP